MMATPDDGSSGTDTSDSDGQDDTGGDESQEEHCDAPLGGDGLNLFRITCPTRTPHAVHHYFEVSPESPDGSKILYTQVRVDDEAGPQVLWVCNSDGTHHRPIAEVTHGSNVGMRAVWIDNDRVAYQSLAPGAERVHFLSLSDPSRDTSVPGQRVSNYSPAAGKLILGSGPPVWTIDTMTYETAVLVEAADIEALTGEAYEVFFRRPQFSPDGARVAFLARPAGGDDEGPGPYLGLVDADGSNLRVFDGTPGNAFVNARHHAWYGPDSLRAMVIDGDGQRTLQRIGLDGTILEMLAGFTKHGTALPSVGVVVANGFANAEPGATYSVYEYPKHVSEPTRLLMQPDAYGKRYTPLPVFNHRASRVYFNAVGPHDGAPQLYSWVYSGPLPAPR